MNNDLQIRYERAQDAIGAYIEELSEMLAAVESDQPRVSEIDGLMTVVWLVEEIRSAGVVRTKLSEYRGMTNGLQAVTQLFNEKLSAVSRAKERGLQPTAKLDTGFVSAVLSGRQAA